MRYHGQRVLTICRYFCVAGVNQRIRQLDLEAAELRARAWAPGTWRTKSSQWKRYIQFSDYVSTTALPTDTVHMCRYVTHLSKTLKYSTIQNYVSGVISLNSYFGYDVKFIRSQFDFIMTLSGVRRVLGDPEPVRPSFTLEDIFRMYEFVDMSLLRDRVLWTCIALSFRGLLRKCNIVPDSTKTMEGHFLRRGGVSFTNWGMEIAVSSSKTIQYGQRVHKVPITFAPLSPLCAATLVRRHLEEFPDRGSDSPVFVLPDGAGVKPVTYIVLLKFLKRLMRSAGLPSERAGMHSLRRAGALYMYRLGLTIEDIRQAGDWASMAALVYLTKPYSLRVDTDAIVSRCLSAGVSV